MPRPSSILVSLSTIELNDFLPAPFPAEIEALSDKVTYVDPETFGVDEWHRMLRESNPEVIVCCWRTPPLPAVLPSNLRYVCYLAGSIKKLVTRDQIKEGLVVSNWGDSISRTIAECALFHIISGLRGAAKWTLAMHQDGAWKDQTLRTASLFNRKVGIHGFGRIARELITLLTPFKCEISAFAPDVDDAVAHQHHIHAARDLHHLFAYNDVVVELAPLIDSTFRIVKESHLRAMRPGSVFVNVGRGAVVDEDALLRVARDGHISIGLDVYGVEPLPADSGFRGLRNVMLTPHFGGPTTDKRCDAGAYGVANLRAYMNDTPLAGIVTPNGYDQST